MNDDPGRPWQLVEAAARSLPANGTVSIAPGLYREAFTLSLDTDLNKLALYFDPTPFRQRLDYIWYFPSADGSVKVQPAHVERLLVRGSNKSEDDFSSDELSDHFPLRADFTLYRVE